MLDEDKKKEGQEKIKALFRELERQKENSYDIVVPSEGLVVKQESDGAIKMDVLQPDGKSKTHDITDHCHGQISEKTKIPKRYYDRMRTEKPELLIKNVNAWLPSEEKKRLVRILDGEVRALLSDRYRIIDNYDIFLLLADEMAKIRKEKSLNFDVKRGDLTDTRLYIKITSRDLCGEVKRADGKKEAVEGGIIITNSEVGDGRLKVEPFMNVLVCQNGLISTSTFTRVHLGKKLDEFIDWSDETLKLADDALKSQIRDWIRSTFDIDIFRKWLDRINEVASTVIEKPTLAVNNIVKKFDLDKDKAEDILNQFINEDKSQWGLAMAVTRLAQDEDNYEEQIKLEQIGNKILTEVTKEELTVEVKEE